MKIKTNSPLETINIGEKLSNILLPGDVILLTGDLSGGKTTITKGIGKGLGVKRIINSPTFNIVKSYEGNNVVLNHFDLYRLNGLNNDFDLEEYFTNDSICVIEWPYNIEELLPKEYLLINLLDLGAEKREITITPIGKRYEERDYKCIL